MVELCDQRYPVEGGDQEFDLFRPNGDGPFPLVVFLHGGGWISGDKTMYRDEALWLAPQGYACACIDYRLAPLYPFPVPVADCQAFVRYARENAAELAIDPSQITAMGNSAGAHLALMLGLCPQRMDSFDGLSERVNAVVSVCGISDLRDPAGAHFAISHSFLEQFMDVPYVGNEDLWRSASPVTYLPHAQGRFLLVHGSDDDVVPVAQSRTLAQGLSGQGVPVKYVELEGEAHSFTYPGWERIRQELVPFLRGQ